MARDQKCNKCRQHAAAETYRQRPPAVDDRDRESHREAWHEQKRGEHVSRADERHPGSAEGARPLGEALQPFAQRQHEPGEKQKRDADERGGGNPDGAALHGFRSTKVARAS
jgi:hypothetical protein